MIHLIIGYQGSGKTLFMVKKAYEDYRKGKKIYSNIHFKKIPYTQILTKDIIACKYENASVFIDEAHLLLPARNSLSTRSREICDGFLSMVRKKNLDVYASTQTLRKIDVRFKEETDFLYECTKYAYYNKTWNYIIHNQDLNINIPVMIKIIVTDANSNKNLNYSFIGNPLFNLFDTRQVIKIV